MLRKLEQNRSEIYIYDLAVAEDRRRAGIATALIAEVQRIAAHIGTWMILARLITATTLLSRSMKD